mgnify:FL=1
MRASTLSFARRLAACLIGLTLVSGATLAQVSENVVFPGKPDRVVDLGEGREIHVYDATVLRAAGNRLTVRFTHGETYTYDVPSDFRFKIDGRNVRTRDLNRGDTVTAYVTVHETAHHAIHHVDESGPAPVVISTATPEPVADMLPSTASPLPLIGLLGALFTALGGLGFAIRRRLA